MFGWHPSCWCVLELTGSPFALLTKQYQTPHARCRVGGVIFVLIVLGHQVLQGSDHICEEHVLEGIPSFGMEDSRLLAW